MKEYRVEVKVKNNLILKKIEDAGFGSLRQFSIETEICYASLLKAINLTSAALNKKGEYTHTVNQLCEYFDCIPEELFSANQMEKALKSNKRSTEVSEAEAKFYLENSSAEQPLLEEFVLADQKKISLDKALETLSPRIRDIIIRREVEGETLQHIADSYGLSRERIREICHKGLRLLRDPKLGLKEYS